MNRYLTALPAIAVAVAIAIPVFAQPPAPTPDKKPPARVEWLTRCNHQLGKDNDAENGSYIFQTLGKKPADATARATYDYSATASPHAAVYATDAKDLMNPYSGGSISLGYFLRNDGKSKPVLGQVSARWSARDFKPIPGEAITMKIVIDGKEFGPFTPSDASSGSYSVWLDTADTDGDSKPPILKAAEFAKLAKAADAMTTAEIVLIQKDALLVRTPVPVTKRVEWRDALGAWAATTAKHLIGEVTLCDGADRNVN